MLPEMEQHGCTRNFKRKVRKEKIMKNKRKFIPCLFTGLLLASIMQIHTAYAAASPSLSASADVAELAAGDYVNISVHLSGNPSISTLGTALSYDSSVLAYDSTSWSSGFSGSDMKMASDTGSEVNLSVVCDSSYSADGMIAAVRFQAVSDTSLIPVTLSLRDMTDADLSNVSDCRVSSQVRVPETSGKKENTKKNQTDTVDLKASEPEQDTGKSTESSAAGNSAADTAGADNENIQIAASDTAAGSIQETSVSAEGGTQSTSVKNAQAAPSSDAGSSRPDRNYKTGAGIGSDILLVLAAACGILALVLAVRKHGEEKK